MNFAFSHFKKSLEDVKQNQGTYRPYTPVSFSPWFHKINQLYSFAKEYRSWEHFLFWSSFTNEQDDQVKKSLIDKKFGFVKRFKKKMIEDLVQDNIQENSSCQGFKESVDEDGREALEDEKEHVFENEKIEKTF